jgi:hypothetical protein
MQPHSRANNTVYSTVFTVRLSWNPSLSQFMFFCIKDQPQGPKARVLALIGVLPLTSVFCPIYRGHVQFSSRKNGGGICTQRTVITQAMHAMQDQYSKVCMPSQYRSTKNICCRNGQYTVQYWTGTLPNSTILYSIYKLNPTYTMYGHPMKSELYPGGYWAE